MKDKAKIEKVLYNLPPSGETKHASMTYESGVEETLLWVLGELPDSEFSPLLDIEE